jgi:F-type H+-transporting ATPase subunit epsilon
MLNPGEIRVTAPGGEIREFAVGGGFAEVKPDKVSVFAESAELPGEIDAERARQALERAKALVQAPGVDPMTLAQAEAAMRRAQVRLRIFELRRHRGARVPEPHGQ